jgi:hypothetical protein
MFIHRAERRVLRKLALHPLVRAFSRSQVSEGELRGTYATSRMALLQEVAAWNITDCSNVL